MVIPFPIVEISGSPFDRGRQYGRQATERIHKSVALYRKSLDRKNLSSALREELLRDMLTKIRDYDASYCEEMEGIADGAGIAVLDVALVNCRTEMLQLAKKNRDLADVDGCTGIIVLPEASADGRLIHAQNWDWRAECSETCVVLVVRRPDGPDLLTFTEAGALARAGVNEAGIAITANYLECDRDYREIGVPLPLIRRKVLEQDHYALALGTVACTRKSASNNMIVSTKAGLGISLECAPDECFQLYPDGGLLVHANHWESSVALTKLRETGLLNVPDSLYRSYRARSLLEAKNGVIGVEDVKSTLLDDWCSPYAICQPPNGEDDRNISATVATIIIRPDAFEMEIAPMPADGGKFTRYSGTDAMQHI